MSEQHLFGLPDGTADYEFGKQQGSQSQQADLIANLAQSSSGDSIITGSSHLNNDTSGFLHSNAVIEPTQDFTMEMTCTTNAVLDGDPGPKSFHVVVMKANNFRCGRHR